MFKGLGSRIKFSWVRLTPLARNKIGVNRMRASLIFHAVYVSELPGQNDGSIYRIKVNAYYCKA